MTLEFTIICLISCCKMGKNTFDIRTKCLRSNNPCNVVSATIQGLASLRNVDEVAAIRGKSVKEILG